MSSPNFAGRTKQECDRLASIRSSTSSCRPATAAARPTSTPGCSAGRPRQSRSRTAPTSRSSSATGSRAASPRRRGLAVAALRRGRRPHGDDRAGSSTRGGGGARAARGPGRLAEHPRRPFRRPDRALAAQGLTEAPASPEARASWSAITPPFLLAGPRIELLLLSRDRHLRCLLTVVAGRAMPDCHAGGRDLASPRGVVVKPDDGARTQNGHIRNDTRGASRRIVDASLGAICRRKCATDDRACTGVTPRW
jgi:hypothetical protein